MSDIRTGGLFRCCLQTAVNRIAEAESKEGDTLQCPHCKGWMVFRDGAWEWTSDNLSMGAEMKYPITPLNLDEFNKLVKHEGWAICTLHPLGLPEFAPDHPSTFSPYQLEALCDENGEEHVTAFVDWDVLVRFVHRRAAEGSEPHSEALKFFQLYTPKEWRFIEEVLKPSDIVVEALQLLRHNYEFMLNSTASTEHERELARMKIAEIDKELK